MTATVTLPNGDTDRDRIIEAACDAGLQRLTAFPSVAILHDHVNRGGSAPTFKRGTEGELLAAALLALGIKCTVWE